MSDVNEDEAEAPTTTEEQEGGKTEGEKVVLSNAGKDEKQKENETHEKKKKKKTKKLTNYGVDSDKEALWRNYMRLYVRNIEKLKNADKFGRREPADLPKLPDLEFEEEILRQDYPLNVFNFNNTTKLPNKLNRKEKIRIWKKLRTNMPVDTSSSDVIPTLSKTDSGRWPGVWPCIEKNVSEKLKKKKKKKNRDEAEEEKPEDDFADHKELGHARIPPICPNVKKNLLVDRAAGEQPGLVDGDYVIFELLSKKKGSRIYADVCLRGLKGMHLPEGLSSLRVRERTWKFCFYQAIVALLAKTQLRYKYASSINIDYIYDHGWMLFTHMGSINVKERQMLDEIVVYNYKYDIEVELVQELKNVSRVTNVTWDYLEKDLKRKLEMQRTEVTSASEKFGLEKIGDARRSSVHPATKKIEEWFDKLDVRYRNCIFRTTRFSLAFWKDGLFWYLYNPYRCDEFGFWDDTGYACIVKFCSRESLKRHLMILMLRAYVYEVPEPPGLVIDEKRDNEIEKISEKKSDTFTIQIFQVIYHRCQLQNVKLLQRGAPKPRLQAVPKKVLEDCDYGPVMDLNDPCSKEEDQQEDNDEMERIDWLKRFKVTWVRCPATRKKMAKDSVTMGKLRWHQFYVEEPYKLFSLWGEIHPTEQIFSEENRGKQMLACYVVCAGMTRIMAPEYWTPETLDVIVTCGDRYHAFSRLEAQLKSGKDDCINVEAKDLKKIFKIGNITFEANVLPDIYGKLYSKSGKYNLWRTLKQMFAEYHFGILTCESSCLGIFKFCGAYYMCDVHSTGPPLFQYGNGVAYLIRATCFFKFMTVLVLTIGSPECSKFVLNPIEIIKVIDIGSANCSSPNKLSGNKCKLSKKLTKVKCPYEDDMKPDPKKWRPKIGQVERRTIDKTSCKEDPSPCLDAVVVKRSKS